MVLQSTLAMLPKGSSRGAVREHVRTGAGLVLRARAWAAGAAHDFEPLGRARSQKNNTADYHP